MKTEEIKEIDLINTNNQFKIELVEIPKEWKEEQMVFKKYLCQIEDSNLKGMISEITFEKNMDIEEAKNQIIVKDCYDDIERKKVKKIISGIK